MMVDLVDPEVVIILEEVAVLTAVSLLVEIKTMVVVE